MHGVCHAHGENGLGKEEEGAEREGDDAAEHVGGDLLRVQEEGEGLHHRHGGGDDGIEETWKNG